METARAASAVPRSPDDFAAAAATKSTRESGSDKASYSAGAKAATMVTDVETEVSLSKVAMAEVAEAEPEAGGGGGVETPKDLPSLTTEKEGALKNQPKSHEQTLSTADSEKKADCTTDNTAGTNNKAEKEGEKQEERKQNGHGDGPDVENKTAKEMLKGEEAGGGASAASGASGPVNTPNKDTTKSSAAGGEDKGGGEAREGNVGGGGAGGARVTPGKGDSSRNGKSEEGGGGAEVGKETKPGEEKREGEGVGVGVEGCGDTMVEIVGVDLKLHKINVLKEAVYLTDMDMTRSGRAFGCGGGWGGAGLLETGLVYDACRNRSSFGSPCTNHSNVGMEVFVGLTPLAVFSLFHVNGVLLT